MCVPGLKITAYNVVSIMQRQRTALKPGVNVISLIHAKSLKLRYNYKCSYIKLCYNKFSRLLMIFL